VGVVAIDAFPLFKGGMDNGLAHPYFFPFVAVVTDLVPGLFKQQFRHDPVTKVAILAFLFPDNLVDVFHAEVFFRKFGMAVQAFLADEFSLLGPRLWYTGSEENDTDEKE